MRNSSALPENALSGHSVKRVKFRMKNAFSSASVGVSWTEAAAWTGGDSAHSAPVRSAARTAASTPVATLHRILNPLELPRQRCVNAPRNLGRMIGE